MNLERDALDELAAAYEGLEDPASFPDAASIARYRGSLLARTAPQVISWSHTCHAPPTCWRLDAETADCLSSSHAAERSRPRSGSMWHVRGSVSHDDGLPTNRATASRSRPVTH